MISPDVLTTLKKLIAGASKPPVAIAQMDYRGTRFEIQTLNPGGLKIGTTLDAPPDADAEHAVKIVVLLARPNAEFIAAAYEHMGALVDDVEEMYVKMAQAGEAIRQQAERILQLERDLESATAPAPKTKREREPVPA